MRTVRQGFGGEFLDTGNTPANTAISDNIMHISETTTVISGLSLWKVSGCFSELYLWPGTGLLIGFNSRYRRCLRMDRTCWPGFCSCGFSCLDGRRFAAGWWCSGRLSRTCSLGCYLVRRSACWWRRDWARRPCGREKRFSSLITSYILHKIESSLD